MKPTIGRIVLYEAEISEGGKKYPAMITEVVDEVVGGGPLVCLAVFSCDKVFFKQYIPQGMSVGQWDWMPFQKDQVARMAPSTLNESHPDPIIKD